jgi:UbiD family decarboxylase
LGKEVAPIPLKEYLTGLPRVKVVKEPVDPKLDVTAALLSDPYHTLWFQGTGGHSLVGNLWPNRAAIADYFRVAPHELPDLLLHALENPTPPKLVKDKVIWRAREEPDLSKFSVPQFYPKDAGNYLTASIFSSFWKGKRNLSYHRFWVKGPTGGPARIVPRHLDRMFREARKEGKELPVAIIVGAPPEVLIAAACSIDYATDEMDVASALHQRRTGKPLQAVELENGIRVPAEAEIVMDAAITLKDDSEGPFLDILGVYDAERVQPVVRVDKVHTVEDPVLYSILPGSEEHFLLMGLPKEPFIIHSVRSVVPGAKAVRLTEGSCGWLNAVISIQKRREGDGKNAIMAAFSGHASLKHVTVVDNDVDIFNDREVEWAIATRFQADKGLVVVPGATGSSLDPSATKDGITTKWGIDATIPLGAPREPYVKETFPKQKPEP